jgi:hypothetical protein
MVAIVVAVANTVVAKVIVMEAVATVTVTVTVTTAVAVGPSHVVSCVPCYWYS